MAAARLVAVTSALAERERLAWAALQENNAFAKIDIASAKVTAITISPAFQWFTASTGSQTASFSKRVRATMARPAPSAGSICTMAPGRWIKIRVKPAPWTLSTRPSAVLRAVWW